MTAVNSDGLTTHVFPAARQGASLLAKMLTGLFHGVISAQTPHAGHRNTLVEVFDDGSGELGGGGGA